MITLFTNPKAFAGHIDTIQRNAIGSWMHLDPECEILLMGDEPGVSEIAAEYDLRHVPGMDRNEHGTPLVSSVFFEAEKNASYDILAYVNTDIILGADFIRAIRCCSTLKNLVLVGERWDLDVEKRLDFREKEYREEILEQVKREGVQHDSTGLDYFVFQKGIWPTIPPFALGRCAWDNWLLYDAWKRNVSLVDCSQSILAVHQNHDYGHARDVTKEAVWQGEEAQKNREMSIDYCFSLLDCDRKMEDGTIKPTRNRKYVLQRTERLECFHAQLAKAVASWKLRYLLCWLMPHL